MGAKTSVVFIGGLSNGKIVLDYLAHNKHVSLPLVITYPRDVDKPRATDISAVRGGGEIVRDLDANRQAKKIKELAPDFIFVAGWSGLLSRELIRAPKQGTIGFHASKLPLDRGRSVLAWQIEEGYRDTALSMFYYEELPDSGDIIAQEAIPIEDNDYIADILDKVDAATYNFMRAYFPLLRKGAAPRRKQDASQASFRRLRTDRDSAIDWNTNARTIYNRIRAISRPYPGAIAQVDGKSFRIWRSEIVNGLPFGQRAEPGTVVARLYDQSLVIRCRDGFLRVLELSSAG